MNITEIVIVIATVVVIIWDIWLYSDGEEGNSITQVIIKRSHQFPAIPFFIGFLMGHFFGDF